MSIINNLDQAQEIINSYISKPPENGNYKLERMKKLMDYLGNPQNNLKTFHIAGTSGKTSTSYYIAALLRAAGYSVGLTVSPHINKVSERALINLQPLPDQKYCVELGKFIAIIESSGMRPSRFELLVAFAFWIFNKMNLDYAIVEVGLGGLLDATNVINRPDKVCIITDIGLDHTKILGETIEEIATQKAGIIQFNNTVFMHDQTDNIASAVSNRCLQKNAELRIAKNDTNLIDNPRLTKFQNRNMQLAVQSVNFALDRDCHTILSQDNIQQALLTTIPARMEKININSKTVILDGSHNEQKIEALVDGIKAFYPDKQAILMVSFGNSEKLNIQQKFNQLRKLGNTIILTKFDKGQDEIRLSIDPAELSEYATNAGFQSIIIEKNHKKAFEIMLQSITGNQIGLVTGSFYLAAIVRQEIVK